MRKLAIFSCAFAAAVAAYIWLLTPTLSLCLGIAALLSAVLLRTQSFRIAAFAVIIGLFWSLHYEQTQILPYRNLCGQDVLITATVSDYPEDKCVQAQTQGHTTLLFLKKAHKLKPGDRIRLRAQVVEADGSRELYYQAQGISLVAFENSSLQITPCESIPIRYLPAHWAHLVRQRIISLYPSDTEGFMQALLMGDRDGIDPNLQKQMSITGLSHVFSVSGMHVSLLVGFFMLLIRRKRLAALCSMAAMLIFAAMLGFSPSVTRSVIMNCVLLMAPILHRENDPLTSLSFALLVLLLPNPWAIANLSLQLSFLAMAGIFLFASKIHIHIVKCFHFSEGTIAHTILHTIALGIATSLSASVFTTPLLAVTFGSVSLIAPISNLLLLQLVSLLFTLGFVSVALPIFGSLMASLLSYPARLIVQTVARLSKLPFASIYTDSIYIVTWLVCVYVLLALFYLFPKERKLRHLVLSVGASLFCVLALSVLDVPQSSITMFDVGQGQSILMQSGDLTVMVDCGGSDLSRSFLTNGNHHLDVLILTHYDDDHTRGLEDLLDYVDIGCVFLPDLYDDSNRRQEIELAAHDKNTQLCFLTQDLFLQSNDTTVKIFSPVSDSSENDGLCALLRMGECDILITGDLPVASERQLILTHDLPQVEFLVAGHHGSKSSTGMELLRKVRPQAVLISVGKNSYGHPSEDVLQRIASVGASVFRTDLHGKIVITR